MKKIYFLGFFLLAITLSSSTCQNSESDSSEKALSAPPAWIDIRNWFDANLAIEDSLRFLWEHYYSFNEVKNGKDYFKDYFKYNDQSDLNYDDHELLLSEVKALYKLIGYNPANHELSALKIHFGMRGKKVTLIFQPAYLESQGADQYKVVPIDTFLVKETGSLVGIEKATFETDTAEYHRNILINHYGTSGVSAFAHFNYIRSFPDGDIDWCVIPIQQIVRMYGDNVIRTKAPDMNDPVVLSIIANDYFRHTNNQFKSHIVFHYDLDPNASMGLPPGNQRFQNLGADFTQLCPPNCNDRVNYRTAQVEEGGKQIQKKK